jgi:hypothetical protein
VQGKDQGKIELDAIVGHVLAKLFTCSCGKHHISCSANKSA